MIMKRKKFLLDENLCKLTKCLRLLGYDAVIPQSISIDKKVSLCQKERRIFLTKSKKIANRKDKFHRILIKNVNYDKQLQEIQNLVDFEESELSSRCLVCNNRLQTINAEKTECLIPKNVRLNFSDYKICRKCGKIYWKGSHFVAMKSKLKNLLTA